MRASPATPERFPVVALVCSLGGADALDDLPAAITAIVEQLASRLATS
jgi:hypothetical protein